MDTFQTNDHKTYIVRPNSFNYQYFNEFVHPYIIYFIFKKS